MGLIFVAGMPGAGKTTVGTLLAEKLGWTFVDLDSEIERRANLTIPEIFARKGETLFRRYETDALNDLLSQSGVVIALGGGTLENTDNLDHIKANGTLIYLRADLDLLVERNRKATHRPLLAGVHKESELRERLEQLLLRREPGYLSASIVEDETVDHTPEQTATHVLSLLRRNEGV